MSCNSQTIPGFTPVFIDPRAEWSAVMRAQGLFGEAGPRAQVLHRSIKMQHVHSYFQRNEPSRTVDSMHKSMQWPPTDPGLYFQAGNVHPARNDKGCLTRLFGAFSTHAFTAFRRATVTGFHPSRRNTNSPVSPYSSLWTVLLFIYCTVRWQDSS